VFGSSDRIASAVTPEILMIFVFPVWPAMISTEEAETRSVLEKKRRMASLAAPSTGGAVMRMESASPWVPMTSSRLALGLTWIAKETAPLCSLTVKANLLLAQLFGAAAGGVDGFDQGAAHSARLKDGEACRCCPCGRRD
jgi:hypothetical protein